MPTIGLEQAVDLSSLGINVDIEVSRGGGQTGYGLDIGCEGVPNR